MTLFLSVLDANLYFLFNVEECSGRSRKGARGAWPPLFLETAPPYLRVWMTPSPPPPPLISRSGSGTGVCLGSWSKILSLVKFFSPTLLTHEDLTLVTRDFSQCILLKCLGTKHMFHLLNFLFCF